MASPVSVLPLDLIDGDVECAVGPLAHRQGFIDAELGCCHRLALREGRQVKAKLLPVGSRLQQVSLLFHCGEQRRNSDDPATFKIITLLTCSWKHFVRVLRVV